MLALISDLHFCDATAQVGNVPPAVFATVLTEVYARAAELAKRRGTPTRLDLVLLGDVFDLLRTERWFEDAAGEPVPLEDRPWATAAALEVVGVTPRVAARARSILAEAVAANTESLGILRGELLAPPAGVEVRRIYLPGNHDRLYLHDSVLRAAVLAALGSASGADLSAEGIFLHRLQMPDYGLIARHGHEWDFWNFPSYRWHASAAEYTDAEYLPTPIGDAITTELAVRLPYEMRRRLVASGAFSPEAAARVHGIMKRIEDVRPLLSAFHWAFYEVERLQSMLSPAEGSALRSAFSDTLRVIAGDFRQLDFYRAWSMKCRDSLQIGMAVALRGILAGMEVFGGELGGFALQFDRLLSRFDPRDAARKGSAHEDLDSVGAAETRLVIYGHTHSPAQAALHAGVHTRDVYLNTGTYRPGVFRTDDGTGFVGWQRLAYTAVYSEEEIAGGSDPNQARFVEWIGAAGLAPRAHA